MLPLGVVEIEGDLDTVTVDVSGGVMVELIVSEWLRESVEDIESVAVGGGVTDNVREALLLTVGLAVPVPTLTDLLREGVSGFDGVAEPTLRVIEFVNV